jgi:hypothetical protein
LVFFAGTNFRLDYRCYFQHINVFLIKLYILQNFEPDAIQLQSLSRQTAVTNLSGENHSLVHNPAQVVYYAIMKTIVNVADPKLAKVY